jgi:peptidoglycan/xylan/chitin deacetylase (PgdA/CDA1 family)
LRARIEEGQLPRLQSFGPGPRAVEIVSCEKLQLHIGGYVAMNGDTSVLTSKPRGKVSQVTRFIGKKIAELMPIWLWRRIYPEPVLCMCYHLVSNAPVQHVKHYPYLATAEFESDLRYLKSHFGFLSYEQIVERRLKAGGTRQTSACLSFDDGFSECFSVVRPILLRYAATCIFFVITDLIDNHAIFWETQVSLCVDAILQLPLKAIDDIVMDLDLEERLAAGTEKPSAWQGGSSFEVAKHPRLRSLLSFLLTLGPADLVLLDRFSRRLGVDVAAYVQNVKPYLTTEQLVQLRSDGFTIGAHSRSHRLLQELSLVDAEREIVDSCRVIQNITGQSSVPFAFPYFGGGIDRRWLARLREQHDVIGLFFDTQGLKRDEPFVVQRVFGERTEEIGSIARILRRAWRRRVS